MLFKASVWLAATLGAVAGLSEGLARGDAQPAPQIVALGGGLAPTTYGLDFSPDGHRLATAVGDKTVRIWDMETGQVERILLGYAGRGDDGDITALRFSPDGRELVVAAAEPGGFALRVYHPAEFPERDRLVQCVRQTGSKVSHLAFSDDGRYLVTVGSGGDVRFWDWPRRRSTERQNVEPPVSQASFWKAAPIALIWGKKGVSRWSAAHAKRVQDLTPAEYSQLPGGRESVRQLESEIVAQMPDATSTPRGWGVADFRLWDFRTNSGLVGGHTEEARPRYWAALRTGGDITSKSPDPPSYHVVAMAIRHDRHLAAYSDELGRVVAWDSARGRILLATSPRSVYTAAFHNNGRRVAFGHRPDYARWAVNRYGVPDSTFDIDGLRVVPGVDAGAPDGPTNRRVLGADRVSNGLPRPADGPVSDALTIWREGDQGATRTYPLALFGRKAWCFGLAGTKVLGIQRPVIAGTHLGSLFALDPDSGLRPREFLGHRGPVSAFDISPDGRLLVSSSLDGTVRFWGLDGVERKAYVDFDDDGYDGKVVFVSPGGQAERAGVRVGDQWLELDGKPWTAVRNDFLEDPWPYRPGQVVSARFLRDGREFSVRLPLVAYGDVVDPLVTLHVDGSGEWVAWTPEGFYAASLQGDRLIGWRVNRSRDESADFYEAQQMRRTLYRPDVLREVFRTGEHARTVGFGDPTGAKGFSPIRPPDIRLSDLPDRTSDPKVILQVELAGNLTDQRVVAVVEGEGFRREFAGPEDVRPGPLTIKVELFPGKNSVYVKAVSKSESASDGFSNNTELITYTPAAPVPASRKPRVYVIAIGVKEFLDGRFGPLDFPEKDAEEFLELWRAQEGGDLYESVRVKYLPSNEATTRTIKSAVEDFVTQIQKDKEDDPRRQSILVVFISTHGKIVERGLSRYYLIPHDAQDNDLLNTAIPSSFWLDVQRNLGSPLYLFIDACRSGAVAIEFDRSVRELTARSSPALVFAATNSETSAREQKTRGHGLFTGAILDVAKNPATDDDPCDAYLSAGELGKHISRLMKERSRESQVPVVPRHEFARTRILRFLESR